MTSGAGRAVSSASERPFLQPIAVALACLVLGVLVLVAGFINLRAMDATLFGSLEHRARDIMANVQFVTQYHSARLERHAAGGLEIPLEPSFADESFSLQENLILDLVSLAQSLDLLLETGSLDAGGLKEVVEHEKLQTAAFLDSSGAVELASGNVSPRLMALARQVATGRQRLAITLFHRPAKGGAGAVCIGRTGGGAVVLSLDMEGLRDRIVRVSARRALEEVSGATGAVYAAVTDKSSSVFGLVSAMEGDFFQKWLETGYFSFSDVPFSRRISFKDSNILQVTAPLNLENEVFGSIHIGMDSSGAYNLITRMRRTTLASTVLLIAVAFLSMWMLYRNQNRHLARLRDMQLQLDRAERLSALGGLAAGVAHEIRNPLNAISMAAQRLSRGDVRELAEVIKDEIRRLNEIVEDFLSFSRTGNLRLELHDLNEIVRQFVMLADEEARSRDVELTQHPASGPVIARVDADKIRQALFNITRNALEAVSGPGKVDVSVEKLKSGKAAVHISDNGRGLTREQIAHMFDPDFTTKEKGLGLGLAIAHEIVAGHGGEILVESRAGEGSRFSVFLP